MIYNLDTLEELERAATPAPWKENEYMDIHSEDALLFEWDTSNENDSELVVALRNTFPTMSAELRRLATVEAEVIGEGKVLEQSQKIMAEAETVNKSYVALIKHHDEHHAENARLQARLERYRSALEDARHIIEEHGTPVMKAHATRFGNIRRALAAEDGEG